MDISSLNRGIGDLPDDLFGKTCGTDNANEVGVGTDERLEDAFTQNMDKGPRIIPNNLVLQRKLICHLLANDPYYNLFSSGETHQKEVVYVASS